MTVKQQQTKLFPHLLNNRQYSGTISTLLYNWPIFAGALFFAIIAFGVSVVVPTPWFWVTVIAGGLVLGLAASILLTTFFVYDWGKSHEYHRLAELGNLAEANVILDITAGKLRGTRGIMPLFKGGHYFLIDLFNKDKMNDAALLRAREMEPPLQANRRIFKKAGKPEKLPVPHNWADVIYCDYSLHELQDEADRDALFKEFARVLKPEGRLLIAEHGRDLPNMLAFGPGVMSFFPASVWQQHIEDAGLSVQHHERWRGLVDLWVVERNGNGRK